MLLLGTLAYLLASIVFYAVTTRRTPSDVACVKTLLPSSMAEEAIEYELRNFHDEFSSKSAYRGPPTVERESKWDSLAPFGLLPLTGQHITASSHSVAGAEKRMTPGDNEDAVLVVPGFVMSMDCLKLLRRYIYQGSNQTIFTPPTRQQADNCIEVLREELMCTLDATPYLIVEDPRAVRGKAPLIGNTHYCRNYESMAHWASGKFVSAEESRHSSILIDI